MIGKLPKQIAAYGKTQRDEIPLVSASGKPSMAYPIGSRTRRGSASPSPMGSKMVSDRRCTEKDADGREGVNQYVADSYRILGLKPGMARD